MSILAFDTSNTVCTVALQKEGEVVSLHQIAPMQQAQLILEMIETLLKQSNIEPSLLHAIAYTAGPGSFTGLRIGSCVAQGLGFAWNLPVIGISSLAALAQTAFSHQQGVRFLVAIDARMGQIYWAEYGINATGHAFLIDKERLCKPDEVTVSQREEGYVGIGDGWLPYQGLLQESLPIKVQINSKITIEAPAILTLAQLQYGEKNWQAAENAQPVYLR